MDFSSNKITEIPTESFIGGKINVTDAVAIQVNDLTISVGDTFDTSTETGANAYADAVALAAAGYVYSVSGGWDGVGLTLNILATGDVNSIVIVSDTGTDVELNVTGFLSKLKKLEKLNLSKNQVEKTAKSNAVSKLEDALPGCWVVA